MNREPSERDGGQFVSNELIGIFQTRELAEEAAALYEIELMSYENEVAVFTCEGDPVALIDKGMENGWPQLSVNRVYHAFGER